MTEIVCTGLDGANPLHMLASLGLLRLADRIEPGARMGWRMESGAWRPVVATGMEPEQLFARAAEWVQALARRGDTDPAIESRVRTLGAETKKLVKRAKEDRKKAAAEAKSRAMKGKDARDFIAAQLASLEHEIRAKEDEWGQAREAVAGASGLGIGHWGDIVGVPPGIVRGAAEAALARWGDCAGAKTPDPGDTPMIIGQLPALACDQVTSDNKVVPTPFSFSNGSSGQCLLKDFRACADRCTADALRASLLGDSARFVPGATGLNWDPADQRSYALDWFSPEDKKNNPKKTDPAANALAYIGLGLVPAVPTPNGLAAVGWQTGKSWTWPIWEPFLPVPVVSSLMALDALQREHPDPSFLAAQCVTEVRRCDRINPTGKRCFFAPSVPV